MKEMALIGELLIVLAAIPATLFPPAYAWIARGAWWRVPAGRALMTSSTALALLLDVTLVFRVVPVSEETALGITVGVLALIAAGAWLKLGALIHDWRHGRHFAGGDDA